MAQAKSKVQKIFGLAKKKSKHTESLHHERQGSVHMAVSRKDSASSTQMPKRAKGSEAMAAITQQDAKQLQREEEYHSTTRRKNIERQAHILNRTGKQGPVHGNRRARLPKNTSRTKYKLADSRVQTGQNT